MEEGAVRSMVLGLNWLCHGPWATFVPPQGNCHQGGPKIGVTGWGLKGEGEKGLARNSQEILSVGTKGQQTLENITLSLVFHGILFFAGISPPQPKPCVRGALGNGRERAVSRLGENWGGEGSAAGG